MGVHRLILGAVACVSFLSVVGARATVHLPDFSALSPVQESGNFQASFETDYSVFKQRAKDGVVASTTTAIEQTIGLKYADSDQISMSAEFSLFSLKSKDDAALAGFARGGQSDLRSYSFRALSEFSLLGWMVKPSAFLALDKVRSRRRDVVSQATAFSKTSGLRTIADIEVYRNFPITEWLVLSPTFKLAHGYTFAKAFEETGAGLSNLRIGTVNA